MIASGAHFGRRSGVRATAVALIMAGWLVAAKTTADEPVRLRLWRHESDAASTAEMRENLAAMKRFHRAQNKWRIQHEILPQGSYTEAITAAALARQLPCILEVDQPVVPNFAWAGHLLPLRAWVPEKLVAPLARGAVGRYRGELYSIGQFDVALAIFARRSELNRRGIRIATMEAPYQAEEFLEILRALRRAEPARFPIDINTAWRGEWLSYGYSPWLQSAGGDLINRSNFVSAEGVLNGPHSLRAARWYKILFDENLAERRAADDQAFLRGEVVFQYNGSWATRSYTEAYGDDLLIIPPVDFGHGPKIGAGSWQWSISRSCPHPQGAVAFLRFLLQPQEIAAMADASGLVPVSAEAALLTQHYSPNGRLRLFFEFVKHYATPRPETPGYPKISARFGKAMMDIRDGKPPLAALDAAVDDIEYDIFRNRSYGFGEAP